MQILYISYIIRISISSGTLTAEDADHQKLINWLQ